MNRFILRILIALIIVVSACKTKKPSAAQPADLTIENAMAIPAKALLFDEIGAAKNTGDGLRYLADADYKEGKTNISLAMEINARKGNYIWLNVKAYGLVNVARVLIKPDSIRILDLINKKYISASYNYLGRFTSAPLGFTELENLVWGNALFDPIPENTTIDSSTQNVILNLVLEKMNQKATYSKQYKTEAVWLTEQGNTRSMAVKYANLEQVAQNAFPRDLVINIEGEKKVECRFTLSNFAYDVKQDPSFNVPRSYKVEVFR
jgi:hypothetical protein